MTIKTKFKMFVYGTANTESDEPHRLIEPHMSYYVNTDEYAKIDEVEVTVDIAEVSQDHLISCAVNTMKEKKDKIQANAYRECKLIDDKIQRLLQLTHQPDVIEENTVGVDIDVESNIIPEKFLDDDGVPF